MANNDNKCPFVVLLQGLFWCLIQARATGWGFVRWRQDTCRRDRLNSEECHTSYLTHSIVFPHLSGEGCLILCQPLLLFFLLHLLLLIVLLLPLLLLLLTPDLNREPRIRVFPAGPQPWVPIRVLPADTDCTCRTLRVSPGSEECRKKCWTIRQIDCHKICQTHRPKRIPIPEDMKDRLPKK